MIINQKNRLTIGIQGGIGSFNDEAICSYIKSHRIRNFKISYLYTTEKVLQALYEKKVDFGQFAIHNSAGGIVQESLITIAKYKFEIVDQFSIKISHSLITRKGIDIHKIDTIMTHPQVFAQCKKTLAKKYPHLKKISGKGKLIDHAYVAKWLSEGKLPKNIATMGSKILAEIYDLKVIENNLQDLKNNLTTFLIVKKFSKTAS